MTSSSSSRQPDGGDDVTDHVTVVALVAANCGYSRRHAVMLDRLASELKGQGLKVKVIAINARYRAAQLMLSELERLVNLTVYQSTHQHHYWSLLGGLKDDIFIYDKCSRLAYYVPFPRSFVPLGFIELAVLSAHNDNPCGPLNDTQVVEVRTLEGRRHGRHHSAVNHDGGRGHREHRCF